jgi:uncharacterized protein (DUF983 family)
MTIQTYEDSDRREVGPAALKGIAGRCPACGRGRLFERYLKVADHCPACDEALHHQRADDAPPYVVISIVGHIVVGLMLAVEVAWHPPIWLHMSLWLPLTVILALALLPPVKGALIGMQWALRMHGFDPHSAAVEAIVAPAEPRP